MEMIGRKAFSLSLAVKGVLEYHQTMRGHPTYTDVMYLFIVGLCFLFADLVNDSVRGWTEVGRKAEVVGLTGIKAVTLYLKKTLK